MSRNFRLKRGTVLGGIAVAALMSGAAVAAIPGGDKTVTVCIAKDGTIKAIDAEAGKACQGTQTTAKLATTDATGKVANADTLDGQDSAAFLGATAKAGDADLLDGLNSTDFLGAGAKAADADKLDGFDAADLEPARIVNVGRAAGATAGQAGAALRAAYDGVSGASVENPVVVRVGPGTFAMGDLPLNLDPYVFLVGSGPAATWLTFTAGVGVSAAGVGGQRLLQGLGISTDAAPTGHQLSLVDGNQQEVDLAQVAVRAWPGSDVSTLVDAVGSGSVISDSHLFASNRDSGGATGSFLTALRVVGDVILERIVIDRVGVPTPFPFAGLDGVSVPAADARVTIRDSSFRHLGNGVNVAGTAHILNSVIDGARGVRANGGDILIDGSRITGEGPSENAGSIAGGGDIRVGGSVISALPTTAPIGLKCAFVYSTDYDPLNSSCRPETGS